MNSAMRASRLDQPIEIWTRCYAQRAWEACDDCMSRIADKVDQLTKFELDFKLIRAARREDGYGRPC